MVSVVVPRLGADADAPDVPSILGQGPAFSAIGFYYGVTDHRLSSPYLFRGTSGAPDDDKAAVSTFIKHSNAAADATPSAPNPVIGVFGSKHSSGAGDRVSGLLSEVRDEVGGTSSFVEGLRSHAIIVGGTLGSGQAGVFFAQSEVGTDPEVLIGVESEVFRRQSTDEPVTPSFSNNRVLTTFLATVRAGDKPSALFLGNPFNTIAAQAGILFPIGTVSHTAFGNQSSVVYGMDLKVGVYSGAQIRLKNNTIGIAGRNALDSADLDLMTLANDNVLKIGVGAVATRLYADGRIGLSVDSVGTAVNWVSIIATATGIDPLITSDGESNIGLDVAPHGTGSGRLCGGSLNPKLIWSETGLGFFGTAPVAKPTGVAVSAAGIHAALVTLGLIAA